MKSEPFDGKSPAMKKDTPWISSEDLLDAGEVAVEIEGVFKHVDAEFDEGRKETVYSLAFKGKQRQLILNATNRKTLVNKFGTTDVKKWIGQTITLYVKKDVRKPGGKRGETTCGIRVK
jgi:hypothetical protein